MSVSEKDNRSRKGAGLAVDVLKLVSGTTFAQLVAILAAPILTRLYAPEIFGIVALFTSLTGIAGTIACLRYELAVMLPEHDEEAANLLGISLGFVFLITLLSIPLIWWTKEPLLRWLNAPYLASYLWLIPLSLLINGIFLALNYWNSRTRHFGRLSIARVTSALTTTPSTIGLGFAGYATAGPMIGATIAGQAVATTVLGGQIWRDDRDIFLKAIRWREMRKGIVRHKKFPLLSTWSALMNTVSVQLPPLLLACFFSSTVVGFYALGHRLLSMPMSLIGGAIGQVFFQRAAVAKIQGRLPAVVRETFVRLMSLGAFPLLLIMITGKEIFCAVFGSQWTEAGVYAQILAPWILFVFFGSPVSTLFSVLEMQGAGLIFNSVLLATRVASLVIGGLSKSILLALLLYAGTGTILWCGLCFFLLIKAGLTFQMMMRDTLKIAVVAAVALLPVCLLKTFGLQPLYIVIAECLCALFYYAFLYFQDEEMQKLFTCHAGRLFRAGK